MHFVEACIVALVENSGLLECDFVFGRLVAEISKVYSAFILFIVPSSCFPET